MTTTVDKSTADDAAANTVSFGARFAQSEQFDAVFKEGMALVEQTAAYLDGPGRREAKLLQSPLTLVYATESMRLTTRLLELASWLLIRRGVKDGELTATEAEARRARVKLAPLGRPSHVKTFSELPKGLQDLVEASFALNDRILKLDQAINMKQATPAPANPVDDQVSRIRAAFAIVGGTDRRH
jgi:regulator of CtrA degradation